MARGRAFTLVEMLVTISVIGVLTGIIIPSVRAVQRESRNAQCLSNLRQDFLAIDSYRQQNAGQLPMCEFLPVVTEAGVDGGLPRFLKGFAPPESSTWLCPEDLDEESVATGTSYVYLPGLLRYTPSVQVDVVGLIATFDPSTMSMAELDELRRQLEARAMTEFFEREPGAYPLLVDSQDRHRRVGSERNGVFLDGSARMAEMRSPPAEGEGGGP